MAGEARSRSDYTAILIPYRLTSADLTPASSFSEDDAMPGVIESTQTPRPKLQPAALGTQATGTTYDIKTQQGGNLEPGGAAFVWKLSTEGATDYRGWDAPNNISSHQFIERGTSSIDLLHPDAASLPGGGVIVVESYVTSVLGHVRAHILGTDGTITDVNVTGSILAPSSRLSDSYHPSVAIMPDDSIVIVHLVEDTGLQQVQLNAYRSTDGGATFSLVSKHALPAPINVDTSTSGAGYRIQRLKFRHAGGRSLLVISVAIVNTGVSVAHRDGYFQFASVSEGLSFDLVELFLDDAVTHTYNGEAQVNQTYFVSPPAITTLDDEFYVAYIGGNVGAPLQNITSVRLSTPYSPISEATQTNFLVGTAEDLGTLGTATAVANEFIDVETGLTADVDGSLYVTARAVANNNYKIARSTDKGLNWGGLGDGITASDASLELSWRPGGQNVYPVSVCLVASGGRLYCYGNHEAPTTTDLKESINEWGLGGWSSVTMPGNTTFGKLTGRAMWALDYFPAELPGNILTGGGGATWVKTTSGTATEAITENGLEGTTTGAGRLFYTYNFTSTTAQGAIVEWTQRQVAGGATTTFRSGVSCQVQDSGAGYKWEARIAQTSAVLFDPTAGAIVSGFSTLTLSGSNSYEYRIEMRAEKVQGWYRVSSVFDDRLWISWGSGTLTSLGGSGSPTTQVAFGPKHDTGAPVTNPETHFKAFRATFGTEAGTRDLYFTNPDDLFPRDYSPQGRSVTLDQNYRIFAVGGPGRRGDEYTGAPRYGYSVDLLHWPDSLSPREAWRSTAGSTSSPQQVFKYEISDNSENTRMNAAIGVFLGGIRAWRTGKLIFNTSGGVATTHTFDLSHGGSFAFTRHGNTVIPSSGSTSGTLIQRNEAIDWWIYLDDGASNQKWIQVERNTEGVLSGGAGMPTRITLRDVPAASPTSGTAYLVPTSAVVLVHLYNEDLFNVQIEIDSQTTEDKRAHLGNMWLGEVYAFPDGPESGARFTTVHGTRTTESEARIPSAQNTAPARREFEIGWTAINHTGAGEGSTADPNFSKASKNAGALPMGIPDVLPYTVEGLYRLCNGPERPVVLLRQIPKQGGLNASRVITGRDKVIAAQITGNVTIRDVAGVPGTDSAKQRGEAVALREIV